MRLGREIDMTGIRVVNKSLPKEVGAKYWGDIRKLRSKASLER
jgi:hypothetical protein